MLLGETEPEIGRFSRMASLSRRRVWGLLAVIYTGTGGHLILLCFGKVFPPQVDSFSLFRVCCGSRMLTYIQTHNIQYRYTYITQFCLAKLTFSLMCYRVLGDSTLILGSATDQTRPTLSVTFNQVIGIKVRTNLSMKF